MRKRIEWSPEEDGKFRNATVDLLKRKKIALPIQKLPEFIKVAREAQDVLEPHRRRPLHTIDAIHPRLGTWFVEQGVLPPNYLTLRKGYAKRHAAQTDPNLIRLTAVTGERDEALKLVAELHEQIRSQQAEIRTLNFKLEAVPTEGTVIKNFVADILYLSNAKAAALPGASHLPKILPPPKINGTEVLEATAGIRKEAVEAVAIVRKPKIVLVGGKPNTHAEVQKALKDVVDLRYVESGNPNGLGDSLKAFKNVSHGRVVLWTRIASHHQEAALKCHNIPYRRVDAKGTSALIGQLRDIAASAAALR